MSENRKDGTGLRRADSRRGLSHPATVHRSAHRHSSPHPLSPTTPPHRESHEV